METTRVPGRRPGTVRRPGTALRTVSRLVERVAARRSAPALHPRGVGCAATLRMRPAGRPWDVPWLDRPAAYEVRMRWSRALGLPGRLPDGLGIALRVDDADGAGRRLDLLFTTSGNGARTRHVPLPRLDALAGPYSALLSYRVGGRTALLALRPEGTGSSRPSLPGDLDSLRRALTAGPLAFTLCAAEPGRPWRALGTLLTGPPDATEVQESGAYDAYDPYLHQLPDLRPTARLSRLREVAYAASRAGRRAPDTRLG
ncbi:phosphodiesterase [Streptomyces sp. NPDC012769]|uniref:phosphodiesterase n=1 Tax=Streptomyces sp. NPDC012769 TaxID=3364848 RepID=UPI003685EED1